MEGKSESQEKQRLIPSNDEDQSSMAISTKTFHIDDILLEIGGFGIFQWFLTFLLGFLWTVGGITMMNMNYMTAKDPNTGLFLPGTVAETFNLTYDNDWIYGIANSVFFGGWWLGVIIHGYLIDIHGRKKLMIFSILLATIFCMAVGLSPNIWVYIVLRSISAFFLGGCGIADWILVAEFWPPKQRAAAGVLFQIFWAMGVLLVPVFEYIIPEWRWYQFLTAIPFLLPYIPYFWRRIPESPRFLVVKGRSEEAIESLRIVARMNGKALPIGLDSASLSVVVARTSNMRDLFQNNEMRKRVIVNAIAWLSTSFMYYSLTLLAGISSGNRFINTLVTGAVEIPAYFIAVIPVLYGTTRNSSILFLTISSICCLLCLTTTNTVVITVLSSLGKFGASGAFASLYVYSIELFPTKIRSLGTGFASQGARLGGMLAPLVILLPSKLIIFGIAGAITAILLLSLPSSRTKRLDDVTAETTQITEN